PDDSIVMMDRGYPSFNLIENLNRHQGLHYLIRAKLGGSIKEMALCQILLIANFRQNWKLSNFQFCFFIWFRAHLL
ncbi:hypothetical protein ACEN34_13160, partial [Loigolactobacillus zhaoyuanensis]